MYTLPTPHNEAKKEDIAKTVLMPGDPLRAKWIAETYLKDAVCVNTVRNMLAYTGTYEGVRLTVMGAGMGMPSMGIYSYELYHHYDVDRIIRIGSAGAICDEVKVRDVVLAIGACTNSSYASQFGLHGTVAPVASYSLLRMGEEAAKEAGIPLKVGMVLSSDTFYDDNMENTIAWSKMGVLAVEMEVAALYLNAARAKKEAAAFLTISDSLLGGEVLSAKDRQEGFFKMVELALKTAVKAEK